MCILVFMSIESNFIGTRTYKEDEKTTLKADLDKYREQFTQPIENEITKSNEVLELIDFLNDFLINKLEELGFNEQVAIDSSKIHLLSSDDFINKFETNSRGIFDSVEDAIYINIDKCSDQLTLITTLLHEMTHYVSKRKFFASQDNINVARTGYKIVSNWKPQQKKAFIGLNELLVDFFVSQTLYENQEYLESEYGISENDLENNEYMYAEYIDVLNPIVEKIAIDTLANKREVYTDFLKGLFTQNLLVLKKVGDSFGKKSLKILGLLGTYLHVDAHKEEALLRLIEKYFSEEDEDTKENTESEIFSYIENNPIESES